ncbi:MAG: phenylalanine--tRNA ligase subunit alpha [Actinobacteria bacterium]|nr:phenylalanine--tRNA ligase subunit alpha [Actinomycetota bacterium]
MNLVTDAVQRGRELVQSARSVAELRVVEPEAFGKRSALAKLTGTLRDLSPDQRAELGRALQAARSDLEELFERRMAELEAKEARQRSESERLDLCETALLARSGAGALADAPPQPVLRGHLHLVTQVREELEDIFVSMGFEVDEGPEVEDDWHNFQALNMPPHHPARGMFDTFYLSGADGDRTDIGPGDRAVQKGAAAVLRTHTSPVQARLMQSRQPPIYAVVPGRCYRRDTPDASHLPVFHQIEGLVVDEGISMAHLAGTLDAFVEAFFGPGRRARLRPSFFPFTEPSAEYDVTCWMCGGRGCRTCAGSGWVELGGCGMVDPAVFEAVGVDPERYTGFAWGFGIDRMAAASSGLADLRDLLDNDIRFLSQF